ncbi:hypothetical protein DFH08DRAFT_845720, partial [Mycena albidolilacea]
MESRFAHHFNTNYIPSDEEIECIRMELVAHTQDLARIDENIRELFAQRAQIQAHIDPYQALISHPADCLLIFCESYSLRAFLPTGTL